MNHSEPLISLLERCTTRISLADQSGTSFFVAPGYLLTCAHERIADAYVECLTAAAEHLTVGDPAKELVGLGPIIDERQRDKIHGFVTASVDAGARLTTGGHYTGLLISYDADLITQGTLGEACGKLCMRRALLLHLFSMRNAVKGLRCRDRAPRKNIKPKN